MKNPEPKGDNKAASNPDPQQLANACADAMWRNDAASPALGMALRRVEPGHAVLTMTVRADMLNGQKICHGGLLFTLADSAFAFACNAYNQFAVAQHCSINFLQPVYENEILTASATERYREGRSGIYDVVVTREDATVVAEFRGMSRTVRGQHIPDTQIDASSFDATNKIDQSASPTQQESQS